ncbi:AI-2E family transporter [Deinococcus sp. Arct2-2]|uniref:AI-2E family transporter n=1 Tax=Deinococcus sp. Arct2-2 TaxID=2568653 RepID=UPI0010A37F21|nr:AI-2E family transporter [Deinococcus sp. Arct2-2]THF71649.1 AI-2E family transporter [Deinococcus sp. Arct2-2]
MSSSFPPPVPVPVAPPSTLGTLWKSAWFRLIVYVMLGFVLLWLYQRLRTVIIATLAAYLIAYLVQPILQRLERYGIRRPFGITLLILAVLGVLTAISPLLGVVFNQVSALVQALPSLADTFSAWLSQLAEKRPALAGVQQEVEVWLNGITHNLSTNLGAVLGEVFSPSGVLVGGLLGAVGVIGQVALAAVISIYMMAVYPHIGPFLLRLLPKRFQPIAADVSGHVGHAVGGYFRGQVVVALTFGVLVGTGLSIIGHPSALGIGFVAALFYIVPYLGVWVALIPALLLAVPLGGFKVLLVAAVFLLSDQLEVHVISPRVVGQNTNLSSLAVVLAVTFGVGLFGVMGVLIAVPLVALSKALLDAYYYRSRSYQAISRPAHILDADPLSVLTPDQMGRADEGQLR